MVNIKNAEVKLLKLFLTSYFNQEYDLDLYFRVQTVIGGLLYDIKAKKEKNAESYKERLFWKEYNERVR